MWTVGRRGLVLAAFLLVLFPTPANAQEEPAAVVAEADVEVTMAADGSDSVSATYTVQATAGEIGDIEHLVALRPGADVGDVALRGDVRGQPVLDDGEGIARFVVTASGRNATYTVSYRVTRDEGVFAVPLIIPDLPPGDAARNVSITTRLPAGQELTGEVFPTVDRIEDDGSLLSSRETNLPSVVIAQYAGGGGLSLSTWISVFAIAIFSAVAIGWYINGVKESRRVKEAIA